jgi:hypothetical protein
MRFSQRVSSLTENLVMKLIVLDSYLQATLPLKDQVSTNSRVGYMNLVYLEVGKYSDVGYLNVVSCKDCSTTLSTSFLPSELWSLSPMNSFPSSAWGRSTSYKSWGS